MLRKLLWRAAIVGDKLSGRARDVPWPLLLREVARRHEPYPSAEVVERDDAAGMVMIRAGEHEVWYPAAARWGILACIHYEVFHPDNPHFYEGAGACLRPGDVAVDVGAGEGYFARYALERGARVLAIEPWSLMAACLERTFAREIAAGEVEVARVLLGPQVGEADLAVNEDAPANMGARTQGPARAPHERVPVARLDDVVARSRFARADFLKVDIEGSEREALEGAAATLRSFRPRLSITTYHRPDDWRVLPARIRELAPEYRLRLKGVVRLAADGDAWRVAMLHGWVP